MPWWRIAYRPDVIADLRKIDKQMAHRLLEKTKWLASNAENLRHDSFSAELPNLAKYAVGDWRIIYSIDAREHLLDVHLIAHRTELFSRAR